MENRSLYLQIKERGYAIVSYTQELRGAVQEGVKAWGDFIKSVSQEEKNVFTYGQGGGYERKIIKGNSLDLKEDFHVTVNGEERLLTLANAISQPDLAKNFILKAQKIHELTQPIIHQFARDIEEHGNLEGFFQEVVDGWGFVIERFIHYFAGQQGTEEIATPHTDKSGFTLHLYESRDGLEYLWNGIWHPLPVAENQTVIFAGMQLQLRTNQDLLAAWHRVRSVDGASRTSLVAFHPLVHIEKYDKNRHGRLQEFKPSSTYRMSDEEFRNLFY
jgi:hypothetical protein